jgi:RNA polymerase sigma-70 factor (ECF subfamily)
VIAPDDDDALLTAWSSGDRAAGQALFERHFEAVARFFRNKADDPIDDLVQKTFLGCIESRGAFRGEGSFRAFLFGVARNVLGKHWRAKARDRLDFDGDEVSVYELGASPSSAYARDQEQRMLLDALRRIPLEYQIVLELHYWESMTAAEIAASLGIPVGTAKNRIRRAKQMLEGEMRALAEGSLRVEPTPGRLDTWARELRETLFR